MKLSFIIAVVFCWNSFGKVETKEIRYEVDGKNFVGLMAWDSATTEKRPGVLVVHEWWGHNAYSRRRAKDLAKLGYTALALDMYGNGKQADHPKEAGKMSGWVFKHLDQAEKRFRAALKELKNHPTVHADRVAAIGYCFGGGVVLNMARRGVPLNVVASFHGSLDAPTPAKPGKVIAKVFVANGGSDPMVKPASIKAFKKEMKAAKVDYQFLNYPEAKHGFTNPGATAKGKKFDLPLAYNKEADKKSWAAMQAFFKKHL